MADAAAAPKDVKDVKDEPMAATEDVPPNHTIYLKNLNDKIKLDRMKASLYAAFSQYGQILEVVMSKARRLRGQAWITFDDVASASSALRAMNGTAVFDKPLVIQFGKDKADVIARREGTFVPREKRKREPKPEPAVSAAASSAKKQAGAGQNGTRVPPPPPPQAQTVPNKILFLQDLPDSCNQEMLSVLFKQYHGFKVRWCAVLLLCVGGYRTDRGDDDCWSRRCDWCRARRASRSSSSATSRRPPSRCRDSSGSS